MPDFSNKSHLPKYYSLKTDWVFFIVTLGGLNGYSVGISISILKIPPSNGVSDYKDNLDDV